MLLWIENVKPLVETVRFDVLVVSPDELLERIQSVAAQNVLLLPVVHVLNFEVGVEGLVVLLVDIGIVFRLHLFGDVEEKRVVIAGDFVSSMIEGRDHELHLLHVSVEGVQEVSHLSG